MLLLPSRLLSLRQSNDVAYLDFLPQSLKISEVIALVLIFIGRQILYVFGFGHQAPLKVGISKGGDQHEMPDLSLSMPFRVSKQDLDQYARAVNLENPEQVLDSPVQSCLLLSAISMPAMLLLLAHHRSPIRPLGSVNVRNRFEILHPELCYKSVLLDLKGAKVRSKLGREARRVKRGLEVDLSVEIVTHDGDNLVIIFRQVFTMLQFMKINGVPVRPQKVEETGNDETDWLHAKSVPVDLSVESPRAWAAICKDYNPIHMSTFAAKIFGFPGKIAHGNFALASAVAQLESMKEFSIGGEHKGLSMEVQFKRPISLPASLVAESVQPGAHTYFFRLMKHGKVCVTASLTKSVGS